MQGRRVRQKFKISTENCQALERTNAAGKCNKSRNGLIQTHSLSCQMDARIGILGSTTVRYKLKVVHANWVFETFGNPGNIVKLHSFGN